MLGMVLRTNAKNHHQELYVSVQPLSDEALNEIIDKSFWGEFIVSPVVRFRSRDSGLLNVRNEFQRTHVQYLMDGNL